MESALSKRPPGDPKLVEAIVQQLKSGGKFDQFRKECLADVDTKPAYQNLQLRVESLVKTYLSQTEWKADLNKNQLRDGVRKHVQESGMLDTGIDTIVNQVVNPKIQSVILPCVQESVYAFLDIDPTKLDEDLPLEKRADDLAKEGPPGDAGGNIGHGPLPPPPGPSQPMPYAYNFPPQHPPPHHYPPQHFAPPAPHYPNHPQHPPVMMPPGPMDVPPIVPPVPMEGPPIGIPPPIAPPLPIEAPPMMPPVPPMEAPPMPLTMPLEGGLMGQSLSDHHFGHHPVPPAMEHLPPPIATHPPYPEPVMSVDSPTEDSTSSDYPRERRDYRSDLSESRQRPQTPVEGDTHSVDHLEYRSKHDEKRSMVADEIEERREHRRRLINRDSPEPLDRHDSRSAMRLHESRRARDVHDSDDGYRVAKYGDTRKGSPERDDHRSRREGEKHEHHRRKYEDYRRGPEEESRRKSEKHSHRSSKYEQRKHALKHYEERRYDSPDTSMEYDTDSPRTSGKHRRRGPYDTYGGEAALASQDRGSHRSMPVHGEPSRPPHSPLIPMDTDVISSEEDEILGAKSSSGSPELPKEQPMVVEEDARDGFSRPGSAASDTMESKVQQLSLQETSGPLFDVQSLDSISSNSSGLSFSASKPSKDDSSLNVSQSSLPGVDSTLGASQPITGIAADGEPICRSSQGDNLLLGASPISAEDSSSSHCTSPDPSRTDESNSKLVLSTSRHLSPSLSSPRPPSRPPPSSPRPPSPSPPSSPRPPSPPLSSSKPPSPPLSCSKPPSPPLSSSKPPSPPLSSSKPPSPPLSSSKPPSPPLSSSKPPSPPLSSSKPSSPSLSSPKPPSPPLSSPKPSSPSLSSPKPPSPLSNPRHISPLQSNPSPLSPMQSNPRHPSLPLSNPKPPSPLSNPKPSSPSLSSPKPRSPPESIPRPPSPPPLPSSKLSFSPLSRPEHASSSVSNSRPPPLQMEEEGIQVSPSLAPGVPVHPVSLPADIALASNLETVDRVFTSEPSGNTSKMASPNSTGSKTDAMTGGDGTVPADENTKDKSTNPVDDHSAHRPSFGWHRDEPDDGSGGDGGTLGGGLSSNTPSSSVTRSTNFGAQEHSQPSQGEPTGSTKEHAITHHAVQLNSISKSANHPYSANVSVSQSLVKTRELMEVEITADASGKIIPLKNSSFSSSITNSLSSTGHSVSTRLAGTVSTSSCNNKSSNLTESGTSSVQKSHINVVARPHHIPIIKGLKTPHSIKKDKIGNRSLHKKPSSAKKEMQAGHVPTAFENALLGFHTTKKSHMENQRRKSELDLKLTPSNIVTSKDSKESDRDKVTQKTKEEKSKDESKEPKFSSKNREKESSSERKIRKYSERESTSVDRKHRKHDSRDIDRRNRDRNKEKHTNHRRRSSSDRTSTENRYEKRTSSTLESLHPDKEKPRNKMDYHTDTKKSHRGISPVSNKHVSKTFESDEKTGFSREKSQVRREKVEPKISGGAMLTKLDSRSNKCTSTKLESAFSKAGPETAKRYQENVCPTSSTKNKETDDATSSNDLKKLEVDHSHEPGAVKNASSEFPESKHSSSSGRLDGKIISTGSVKRALSSDSSSEDEEKHLPMKKRFSKSVATTVSTDDELIVRCKRKIVKMIDTSSSCADEISEQKDKERKPIIGSINKRKISEITKETPVNTSMLQSMSMADSCDEDSLPVKKRITRKASKNSSESDDEVGVKRFLESPNNQLRLQGNLSRPKKNSVNHRNSEISSSDEEEVLLKKARMEESLIQNERLESVPNESVSEHNLAGNIFQPGIHPLANPEDDSDSSDSFYDELLKQTCVGKNSASTKKLKKRRSSQSLERASGDSFQKAQKRKSKRKPRNSTSQSISVTEEGVVITADHGKKILLSYDENSLSRTVDDTDGLFNSDDSDIEEFQGFASAYVDYKRSSPVVVLEDMYDFVGFNSSISTKAEKLRQYIQRQKSRQKIYSVDDLSMTVTGDMFGPELPLKVFLDAMVDLGAKVSGFHAFLANSPKNSSWRKKIVLETTVSCSDSSDSEILGRDQVLDLDSECDGVLSSENESFHASKNAPQVRVMVDRTTSLPSKVEIHSGAAVSTTEIMDNPQLSSRTGTMPTKPGTPQCDSVLLTPPEDEYSEGSSTPPKAASPYAPLSPSTSDGSTDTSGLQCDVVTRGGGE